MEDKGTGYYLLYPYQRSLLSHEHYEVRRAARMAIRYQAIALSLRDERDTVVMTEDGDRVARAIYDGDRGRVVEVDWYLYTK